MATFESFRLKKGFEGISAFDNPKPRTSQSSVIASSGSGGYGQEEGDRDDCDEHRDDDLPEDDGGDDGDDGDSSGDDLPLIGNETIVVYVQSAFVQGMTATFRVKKTWQIRALKFMVFGKWGIQPSFQRFVDVRGNNIYDHLTFEQSSIRNSQTLMLQMIGRGGVAGRGVNRSIRKTEALNKLAKKTEKGIRKIETIKNKDDYEEQTTAQLPPALAPLTEQMKSLLNRMKSKIESGDPVIRSILNHLSDEQLANLMEIHRDTQHTLSEQKMIDMAKEVVGDINTLDAWAKALGRLRMEMLCLFSTAYTHEYNAEKGANIIYANTQFKADVKEVIDRRSGQRLEREAPPAEAEGDRQRCPLM